MKKDNNKPNSNIKAPDFDLVIEDYDPKEHQKIKKQMSKNHTYPLFKCQLCGEIISCGEMKNPENIQIYHKCSHDIAYYNDRVGVAKFVGWKASNYEFVDAIFGEKGVKIKKPF